MLQLRQLEARLDARIKELEQRMDSKASKDAASFFTSFCNPRAAVFRFSYPFSQSPRAIGEARQHWGNAAHEPTHADHAHADDAHDPTHATHAHDDDTTHPRRPCAR